MTPSDSQEWRSILNPPQSEPAGDDKRASWPAVRGIFWIVLPVSVVVLTLAWFAYGFAFSEEMSEQCRAVAAGSTAKGTGILLGGSALVVGYALVCVATFASSMFTFSTRVAGLLIGLGVLIGASTIAIAINQLAWDGDLFTMSAASAVCDTP